MKTNHKFPWNFVPFFIGTEKEMIEIINGHLQLQPIISQDRYDKVISALPLDYSIEMDVEKQMEKGYIVNLSDFNTCGRSLYPIEYCNGQYLPIESRYREMGDYALVILYPDIVLMRMNDWFGRQFPHLYEAVVKTPIYLDGLPFDNFAASELDSSDEWKKEYLLLAEVRPDIAIGNKNYPEPISIEIGAMNEIAEIVPVESLIKGIFPEKLKTEEYIAYLQSFEPKICEITAFKKSFKAEVMEIEATRYWINELSKIFPPDQWRSIAFSEKLRADGASMARLSFHRITGSDSVSIGINHVDFNFYQYGEAEKKIVYDMIYFVEKVTKKRFALLKNCIEADIGIRDDKYQEYLLLDERFTVIQDELFRTYSLITDSRYGINIFGESAHKDSWRYSIEVSTPPYDSYRWYNANQAISFFDKQDEVCKSYYDYLISTDDPYETFQVMKRARGKIE